MGTLSLALASVAGVLTSLTVASRSLRDHAGDDSFVALFRCDGEPAAPLERRETDSKLIG
jgi:hypothetical protein